MDRVPAGSHGETPASPVRAAPVPLYLSPPTFPIALDELEQSARGRAAFLALLSALGERASRGQRGAPAPASVRENAFYQQLAAGNARLDLTSHYALRLAFCKTHGTDWKWLVDSEAALLALRLSQVSAQQSLEALRRLGVAYEGERARDASSDSPSESESEEWTGFHRGPSRLALDRRRPTHFRVPFEHATRLVRLRRAEMRRGVCLVAAEDMRYVAVHHFRSTLQRQMKVLSRSLLLMDTDESERLEPVLARVIASLQLEMARQGTSVGGASSGGDTRARIRLDEIDDASEAHFPLCMRHLHRKLREHHHLKYDGRVQYRMFLKGLGLSVHESLLFFRSEFTKVIPTAKFDTEYAYHIRHSYGLEGSRRDYAPLDCNKITSASTLRHGQYHGCPFRHWDVDTLRRELMLCGLAERDSASVTSEAASGRHRSACRAFFDATHRVSYERAMMDQTRETSAATGATDYMQVRHPNAYVAASIVAASARSSPAQRGEADAL